MAVPGKNLAATKKFHAAVVDANHKLEKVAQLRDNLKSMLQGNMEALPEVKKELDEYVARISRVKDKLDAQGKLLTAANAEYAKAKKDQQDAEKAYASSSEGKEWSEKNKGAINLAATKKFASASVDANVKRIRIGEIYQNLQGILKGNQEGLPAAQAAVKEHVDRIASVKAKLAAQEKLVAAAINELAKAKAAEKDAEKAYASSDEGKKWAAGRK